MKPGRIVLWTFGTLVLAFLLVPLLVVVPMSFGSSRTLEFPPQHLSLIWYQTYFTSSAWLQATWVSLRVALEVTLLATLLGTVAAFGLVRGRFPLRDLLYGLMLAPLVVPGIVLAIGAYLLFGRIGMVGSIASLVLADTVLALPMVVVNVAATLQGFDPVLERAAMSAGAGRVRTFFLVTFPLIRPGVVAGALLAFLTSFDEVNVAIFLAGRDTTTLPKRMWDSVLLETDPTLFAISTLLLFLTSLVVIAATVRRSD